MADGKSTLRNVLRSDDSYWCLEALRELGLKVEMDDAADPATVTIEGCGGRWPRTEGKVYMGAAGTIARFLPGALAAAAPVAGTGSSSSGRWVLEGSKRLSERPIAPLVDALNELGGRVEYMGSAGQLPLRVELQGLEGGTVTVSGAVSSQFISGLLLASPYAREKVEIRVSDGGIVQHAYVRLTLDLMKQFGVNAEVNDSFDHFVVNPQRYVAGDIQLESDASTCCYFLAYAALTGGHVRIRGISADTNQPDIGMLDILDRMGCQIERGQGEIELRGPAAGAGVKGGFTVSMREMSDQTLTLAVLAVFADAPITITEVEHIRAHECDRIRAMCESLTLLGIQVEERRDGMTIFPGKPLPTSNAMNTYDDHRMAMSLALIASRVGGIRLKDPGCVSKTCPDFFQQMRKLGLQVR
jgi:3-phosphoshikimate 1-carboxyvinyltransferase